MSERVCYLRLDGCRSVFTCGRRHLSQRFECTPRLHTMLSNSMTKATGLPLTHVLFGQRIMQAMDLTRAGLSLTTEATD